MGSYNVPMTDEISKCKDAPPAAFDKLMRGLVSVPKVEVDAEEKKYQKAKRERAKRIAGTRKKK